MNPRKQISLFLICTLLIFCIGCHSTSQEDSDLDESGVIDMGNGEKFIEVESDNEFTPQDIKKVRDAAATAMVPEATGKNKEELDKLLEYLDDVEKKAPDYFREPSNTIEYLKVSMRLTLLAARLKPDNFDINLDVSSNYFKTAYAMEGYTESESDIQQIEVYRKKGLEAARDLVKRFPDKASAYGQLAYSVSITGGDKKEAIALYKRCLEIDKDMEYCKESYDALRDDGETKKE